MIRDVKMSGREVVGKGRDVIEDEGKSAEYKVARAGCTSRRRASASSFYH